MKGRKAQLRIIVTGQARPIHRSSAGAFGVLFNRSKKPLACSTFAVVCHSQLFLQGYEGCAGQNVPSIKQPGLRRGISCAYRVATTAGTIITMRSTMIPTIKHMRIFISFHHICFRTLFAPLLNPWAETARLSVLSCNESSRSPLCDTLLMFSRITPTVSSICACRAAVLWLPPGCAPPPCPPEGI